MAIGIGESISLGNIATPDRSQPITNAIIRKQNLDLKQKAQDAKQAELDRKRDEDIASMMQVKGGFLPYHQEEATNLVSKGYGAMMGAETPIERNSIAQHLKFNTENLLAENNQLAQNLNTARGKGLVPDKVFEIFNMPKSKADKAYDEYVKTNPEIQEIVYKTPEGKLQFNPVEKVDLRKVYDDSVQKLKETAIPKKDANGNWEKVKMLDNTYQFRSIADPAAVNQTAVELAHDANFGSNVRISQPKEYKAAYDKLAADAVKGGMQVTHDDLKIAATAQVIKKSIEEKAIYNDIRGENQAKTEFNFSGFGNRQPIDPFNANKSNTIPVKVTVVGGGTEIRKVPLGNTNSFKTVSIINTKPAGAINADDNTLSEGTIFEKVDVGDVVPVPIATTDMYDKNTGVRYKKGQMVDEKSIKGLTQNGMVEYVPMFKAIGTYKNRTRTATKSILVPAAGTADAVVASQAKDDAPMTASQIQNAFNEAKELNLKLSKGKSAGNTVAPASLKGKTYKGLDKNGNPLFK